jgi:hypothetical protein
MPFLTFVSKFKSTSLPNININNETTVNSAPINIPAQNPTSESSNNNIEPPIIHHKCQAFAPPLPNAVITQSQNSVHSSVELTNNPPSTQTDDHYTAQETNNTSNKKISSPVETAVLVHH